MLEEITIELIFSFILVFSRLGAVIMLLPAMSETYMSQKARLVAALGLSIVVVPAVKEYLPNVPSSALMLCLVVAGELVIGVLIGTMAKIVLSALSVAGELASMQMGLSAAMMFDPGQKAQGSIIGVLLTFIGVILIFATDLHHVFLRGLVDSYQIFTPATALPLAGFADLVGKTVSQTFIMGFKIAAPQIVIGLMLYLGAGVMGRLMPQMQVFFVMMPVQIGLGFFVMMLTLSASMMWFMSYYGEVMGNFIK